MEPEDSQLFSDSDITTTSSICYPTAVAAAGEPLPSAEVAALTRLSKHLGSLRRSPGLAFCADACITVQSSGGDPPHEVPVHRCVLSARSPFFLEKFAGGSVALELGELVAGFEVGREALEAVLEYIYTGRPEELPRGVAECADESCHRHEACWPAVHFMLQVLHAAFRFEIYELVSLFQCQRLLLKCIEMVVKSDIDYMTLEKKLPGNVVKQIVKFRSNLGSDGQSLGFPDKHVKSIYGALDMDDIELVKMLLYEKHTSLDDAKALHYAVAYCDPKTMKQLLDLELADVNGKDHRGYTVLHVAAMRKEPEIIMSLLTRGAQPSYITSDGRTSLQISKMHTRSIDYCRPVKRGETSPKERLCIEMLERAEAKDSPTEATSVPVEMISDNLREKLLYLESRVWLAERLFPAEAKTAMNNANVDGTLKFKSSSLLQPCAGYKRSVDDVAKASLEMTAEQLSRMEALSKTVQLGMRFFPRCSNIINKILCDDLSELSIVERVDTEERKNRYNEILEEMKKAFSEDKKKFDGSASASSSSSKSARAVRAKVAKS
ncbi:hypothetical protein B296_00056641 [Ensete ventricosum]|uniref:BTB domain-containing protein n=1 Tax=Ensete ventricosum TaxID=4639 RepID=A0A426XMX8_ENSVE|nr:hypothetical protein B296_00056641 [Ensete ventricosum]